MMLFNYGYYYKSDNQILNVLATNLVTCNSFNDTKCSVMYIITLLKKKINVVTYKAIRSVLCYKFNHLTSLDYEILCQQLARKCTI